MTCRDTLQCVHEPFGDAWYFGPERLHDRYEKEEKIRLESGFADSTFKSIFDRIEQENTEGKRLFIKDMAQYWMPPNGMPSSIAPSLVNYKRGVGTNDKATNGVGHLKTDVPLTNGAKEVHDKRFPYDTAAEPNNPTVVPDALLRQFHFTFLIRHPRNSIPSYYRCTVPPLDDVTGFYKFMPNEAGYVELRALFDYLRISGQVGPHIAGQKNESNGVSNGVGDKVDITLIDADDLLDAPYAMIEEYCKSVGLPFSPDMLNWDNEVDQKNAKIAFEKWRGFHDDAIDSTELRPRKVKVPKPDAELFKEWTEKFGEESAKEIRQTVKDNEEHYKYLKQFAIKLPN